MSRPRKTLSDRSETALTDALTQALFGADVPKVAARAKAGRSSQRLPFSQGDFEAGLQSATERAAVMGRFLPTEVVKGVKRPVAEAVLSSMAPYCDIELRGDSRVWMLGRDRRRSALASLCEHEERSQVLSLLHQAPAHEWDQSGRYLQSILRDGAPVQLPSSLPAMRALVQACDWASSIVDVKAAEQKLRQAIAFRSFVEEKNKLLGKGFFGRKEALSSFEIFMQAKISGSRRSPPVLMVYGIGGSGKSTFLAAVTRELVQCRGEGAPAVFSIDFDRFGLGPSSLIELTFEITRQIALYDPEVSDEFAKLRREMREQLAMATGTDTRRSSRHDTSIKFLDGLLHRVRAVISPRGWGDRDALLVLDTFEELQAKRVNRYQAGSSGVHASNQIATWISQLVSRAGLRRLRVIVSGRAPIEAGSELYRLIVEQVELKDLDPRDGILLLTSEGLSADVAAELQLVVGGNPLLLRIAARLIRRLPRTKRAAVLRDLAKDHAIVDKELVQGFLYNRILQHIRDVKARKLAHPGLVLRRVTWRLIRDVLAQPCGLDRVDESEAQRLWTALGDEVWLVTRDAQRSDVLLHRSDIRRLMLRLMSKDEVGQAPAGAAQARSQQRPDLQAGAAVVRDIHRRALAFYTARRDPGDRAAVADAEAFYHRMMLVDEAGAASVTQDEISRIAATFGGDIELLTPALRLRVRQLSGEPLSLDEAELLPEDDWRAYVYREGQARLDSLQEPLSALSLVDRRPVAGPAEAPEWQLRALDAAARWDVPATEWLERVQSPQVFPRGESESWASHSATKSLLLMRRGQYATAMVISNGVLVEMRGSVGGMAKEQEKLAAHLRCANYAQLAGAAYNRAEPGREGLMAVPTQADWPFDRLPPAVDHPALDLELRRYAALTWRPGATLPFQIGLTAHAFVPDPAWLRAVTGLTNSDMAAELGGLRDGASIADILGRMATAFARRRSGKRRVGLIVPRDDFDPMLMCADSPEMRPAAGFALRQAFPTHRDLRGLAELTLPRLPIVPSDLQPDTFADPDRLPAHAITLLVEYADRSGVLANVLAAAAAERPASEPLQKVSASVTQWRELFTGTFAENRTMKRTQQGAKEHPGVLPFIARATAAAPRQQPKLGDRRGYDPHFLGLDIPIPRPEPTLAAEASSTPLHYCRFSVLLSRRSRAPICAAANIGGDKPWPLAWSVDRHAFQGQIADPRLPSKQQSLLARGASFAFAISPNAVAYGGTEEAVTAIGDTRFAPNHIPLDTASANDVKTEELWNAIDSELTRASRAAQKRAVLFTGMVQARGAPRWKVIATQHEFGGLRAAAFVMRPGSKSKLLIWQVRLADLAAMVGLSFGLLIEAESLARNESLVSDVSNIVFPEPA